MATEKLINSCVNNDTCYDYMILFSMERLAYVCDKHDIDREGAEEIIKIVFDNVTVKNGESDRIRGSFSKVETWKKDVKYSIFFVYASLVVRDMSLSEIMELLSTITEKRLQK